MSSRFSSASRIEEIVWAMKMADFPRGSNRARIDKLFNGNPPYSDAEARKNNISTNVNFLESTQIAHNARRQFSNAFLKPGNFFNVRLDSGPIHKRDEWGNIITEQINKQMKRGGKARHYRETLRNVFAQVAIHGIGPVEWSDRYSWVPDMHMLSDIYLPTKTLLTMENLPYFSIYRRYTAEELWRKTHGPKVDSGWNMPVVEACLRWAHKQVGATFASNDAVYNPERWQEDFKEDGGSYGADQVPTINAHDFYYLNDDKKNYGWRRRIILDVPSDTDGVKFDKTTKTIAGSRGEFLYDSGERKYADTLDQILHFQFADGSVVAPFRYYSVRGLGFLLYSVCHLQNRLRCKFNDHIFESLLQYFRVSNPNDSDRLQKIDLVDKGIIPDGMSFVPVNERWAIKGDLVGAAMNLNRQSMEDSSSSSTQDFDFNKESQSKTATQYIGEANATSAMVGSMLQEAYGYQEFQYYEIGRRLCIKNSRDASAREFRNECLRRGVPEEYLDVCRWQISAERVIGSGNKQLEIAQTQMLMQQFNRFDPDGQRLILRDFAFAVVDDAAKADALVPFKPGEVTSAKSFAQVSMGTLMLGLPVQPPPGINHIDVVETWMAELAALIARAEKQGGMVEEPMLVGMANVAQHIARQIEIIAQDPEEKLRVKQYGDDLAKMENMIRAYDQRLQEQQQAQQGQDGQQQDGDVKAKVVSSAILAQTQAKIKEEQAAQKMQHKQQAFEADQARKAEAAQVQNMQTIHSAQVDTAAKDIETAASVQRELSQPEPKPPKQS